MPKIEKKLLLWIDQKKEILFVLAMAAVSLLMRFPLRNVQAGNVPGKLAATFCDYLLAGSVAAMVYFFAKADIWRKRKMVLAFAVILFAPGLVFSSAVYGYGDSFLILLLLWTAMLLLRGHSLPALCLLGLAAGLDLRALFLLPFTVFMYGYRKDFSILCIPAGAAVAGAVRFSDRFTGYRLAGWFRMHEYVPGRLYQQTPSFWAMFEGEKAGTFSEYAPAAAVLMILALIGTGMLVAVRRESFSNGNGWFVILLFALTGGFLLPGAGAGALLFAEVLAILAAFFEPKTMPLAVLLHMTDVILFAAQRYGGDWMPLNLQGLSLLTLAVLLAYFAFYTGCVTRDRGDVT